MSISSSVRGPLFRSFSVLMAVTPAYATSAIGFNAAFSSLADAIRTVKRLPNGHYTTQPGQAYLGKHPGRDEGRGVWSKVALANAKLSGDTVSASIDPLLGGGGVHSLSVSPAPGSPYSWEGAVPSIWVGETGPVNTGNGDKLTVVPLLSWKDRSMTVDFTLYHNSESNYSDEMGSNWTTSADVYINDLTSTPTVHYPDGLSVPYTFIRSSYVPPAGVYDQLVQNGGGTWTVTRTDGSKIQFNSSGYMTAKQDRNGNQITYTLNSGFYCTKITGPDGKYLTINLNGSNQVTSIVDPLSRTWSFTINGSSVIRRAIGKGKLPPGTEHWFTHDPVWKKKVHQRIGKRKINGGNGKTNGDLTDDEVIEIVEDEAPPEKAPPSTYSPPWWSPPPLTDPSRPPNFSWPPLSLPPIFTLPPIFNIPILG